MSKKYKCGTLYPSGCVTYTGDLPVFLNDASCDANLDEIIKKGYDKLQLILDGNDFSHLNEGCFQFSSTVTAKELHQLEINKICDHESRLLVIENSLTNFNIGAHLVIMDLGCLAPLGSACAVATNTYTLLSILNILRTEICAIKSNLNI